MEISQVALLTSLAKEIKIKKKDRASIVASLKSAKIITRNENFTSHFSHLKKVVTSVK